MKGQTNSECDARGHDDFSLILLRFICCYLYYEFVAAIIYDGQRRRAGVAIILILMEVGEAGSCPLLLHSLLCASRWCSEQGSAETFS